MNSKSSSFSVLLEDLKTSFKFALKNIISFFLALIGVLLVSVFILVIFLVLAIIPIYFLTGGWAGMFALFIAFGDIMSLWPNPAVMGLVLLIVLPIICPFLIAIGALFGMGREIVESAGTSAEGVFTWYRRKFFALAGGGIILFMFSLFPIMMAFALAQYATGGTLVGIPFAILTSLSVIWFIISMGFLSMLFPAIIDGLPVLQALKQSVRMAITYFDRVFSTWLAFVLIMVFLLSPAFLPLAFIWLPAFDPIFMAIWLVPAVLFLILVAIPALAIALNRVYLILSGVEVSLPEEELPDVSLVGGM